MCIIKELSMLPINQINNILQGIYLTPDESDVLTLVMRGYSNTEIALRLHISDRTVSRRKQTLKVKLANLKGEYYAGT